MDLSIFANPETWVALLTLTALEIVLGIDNIVFISILAGKLPRDQQERARRVGLGAALIMRIALLFSLSIIVGLTAPIFNIFGNDISGRDIVLIVGGLFLLAKATFEIHEMLEGEEAHKSGAATATFGATIVQIGLLDIVFSLDSVITAVGMVDELIVMILAVIIAVLVMLVSSRAISNFVHDHPTVKMLALSFLLLIGMSLVADGWGLHISKEYIYFAMGFSVFVELLNLRLRKRRGVHPIDLRPTFVKDEAQPEQSTP
jgi:predicted tellurium resistance membrane protein TerC